MKREKFLERDVILDYIKVVDNGSLVNVLKKTSRELHGFSRNKKIPRILIDNAIVKLCSSDGRDGEKIRNFLNELIDKRNSSALKDINMSENEILKLIGNKDQMVKLCFKFTYKSDLLFTSYLSSKNIIDDVCFDIIKEIELQLIDVEKERKNESEQKIESIKLEHKKQIDLCHKEHTDEMNGLKSELKNAKVINNEISSKNNMLLDANEEIKGELEKYNAKLCEMEENLRATTQNHKDAVAEVEDIKEKACGLCFDQLVSIEDLKKVFADKEKDEKQVVSTFYAYLGENVNSAEAKDEKLSDLWLEWIDYEKELMLEYMRDLKLRNLNHDKINKIKEIQYLAETRALIVQVLQSMGYRVLEEELLKKIM